MLNQIADSLRAEGDSRLGAVLFIDLDNLKAINDSLGHDSGDELLKRVGQCLRTSVAPHDVVGRLGGDEFVVLITGDVGPADLGVIVGELERSLAEPMDLGTATVRTQASIGVTVVDPDDQRSPIEILRDADTAMYVTKSTRRATQSSGRRFGLPTSVSASVSASTRCGYRCHRAIDRGRNGIRSEDRRMRR